MNLKSCSDFKEKTDKPRVVVLGSGWGAHAFVKVHLTCTFPLCIAEASVREHICIHLARQDVRISYFCVEPRQSSAFLPKGALETSLPLLGQISSCLLTCVHGGALFFSCLRFVPYPDFTQQAQRRALLYARTRSMYCLPICPPFNNLSLARPALVFQSEQTMTS